MCSAWHKIRRATVDDAAEIARLSSQLGYPSEPNAVRLRLERLLKSRTDLVLVAQNPNGGLGGWIHAFESQLLESDVRVEIGGLVVDTAFQRRGIGRELIRQVEAWAMERGLNLVNVRCQEKRKEAHLFYERLGFERVKAQIVFRKRVE